MQHARIVSLSTWYEAIDILRNVSGSGVNAYNYCLRHSISIFLPIYQIIGPKWCLDRLSVSGSFLLSLFCSCLPFLSPFLCPLSLSLIITRFLLFWVYVSLNSLSMRRNWKEVQSVYMTIPMVLPCFDILAYSHLVSPHFFLSPYLLFNRAVLSHSFHR